jgi:hypothetical protein
MEKTKKHERDESEEESVNLRSRQMFLDFLSKYEKNDVFYNTIVSALNPIEQQQLLDKLKKSTTPGLQEFAFNANIPNETFADIIISKREFSVLTKLNEDDPNWLKYLDKNNQHEMSVTWLINNFPPLIQLLVAKYLEKMNYDIQTWYSPFTPKLSFTYDNNNHVIKITREYKSWKDTSNKPSRDSYALNVIADALDKHFKNMKVERISTKITKQPKDTHMLIINQLQPHEEQKLNPWSTLREKIPTFQILQVVLASLFMLEKTNSHTEPNVLLESCIFCGDQATHYLEDDEKIKVCENELCQLKI